MIKAEEALDRLQEGNRRFVEGLGKRSPEQEHSRRRELVDDQEPFAIVLGCSDSRVPSELIFDQGLGDLFVIRVAGNIVAPSQIGSIEFAAGRYGTPLVVVLGHSGCGAVIASVDQPVRPEPDQSPHLGFIVKHIRPSVDAVLESRPGLERSELIGCAIRENIRATVRKLQRESDVLAPLIRDGRLRIVGAEYALETGRIEFLQDTLWHE